MKPKSILTGILLVFVAVSIIYVVINETGGANSPSEETGAAGADSKVVAYYFHGNTRCNTCRTIEKYTRETIQLEFKNALKDGRLVFKIVNIEEPQNTHFVQDFQLTNRSVVLVKYEKGVQTDWSNLEQVWDFVSNRDDYAKYIKDETNQMLMDGV